MTIRKRKGARITLDHFAKRNYLCFIIWSEDLSEIEKAGSTKREVGRRETEVGRKKVRRKLSRQSDKKRGVSPVFLKFENKLFLLGSL